MPQAKDYLANRTVEPGDKVDHGVKGMHWGVRRSSATLKSAAAKKAEGSGSTSGGSGDKSAAKAPYEGETSSARYARLAGQAKAGNAHQMSEPDLKFFNSRTDALAKVAKMNETKPNWVAEAAKSAGKSAVQQTMNKVAAGIAEKYISGPLLNGLTGGKGEEVAALGAVAKAVATPMSQAVASQPTMPSLLSRAKAASDARSARAYGGGARVPNELNPFRTIRSPTVHYPNAKP